jgi:hypothetical protein
MLRDIELVEMFLVPLTEPFGLGNYIGSSTSAKAMVLRQMERLESSGSEDFADIVLKKSY